MSEAPAADLPPSPERAATTLAQRARLAPSATPPFQHPGPGSADARVDLKLAAWRAWRAAAAKSGEAARERLAGLDTPDLAAGTIQDGTARGLAVAYEEALSLCPETPAEPDPFDDPLTRVLEGKELRKQREFLVESGGARVRFSRKGGVHLIVRDADLNVEHCVAFEDRADLGTLDGFVAKDDERARLFSPTFLRPVQMLKHARADRLTLHGRLGRRPTGFPCELLLEGRRDETTVRMVVRIHNQLSDHRLRVRFLGVPRAAIASEGTPGFEEVTVGHRRFVAATLVRACGRLRVGDRLVEVPGAQVQGWIEHRFRLG
ncbi:MAG: hypothetical protein R3F56_20370 [Planctomycetota bacterium]